MHVTNKEISNKSNGAKNLDDIFKIKYKCHECTTFTIILKVRFLIDDDEIKVKRVG